ncbi:Npun_R2821/Npun_R2822 family protein [Hydrocoleum sp. CS-953]|uniref:Npun_R2821/Npun_R2822 family protein n=1 Tax=Hydrocoleum sp. CS-953 TaxID=1671698 RepID=UPI001FEE1932|nr:Npun_R2821/Npun_R2822 family protein [Hydrocoleum sp. CS-953]
MFSGIYTLANDTVYDQMVALLNSIEKNIGTHIPVCIIPYNDHLRKVKWEIQSRPNVTLFSNLSVIQQWDNFINDVWEAHPRAKDPKYLRPGWYKGFVHRKFAAFEGEFERFVFFDADSLAMKPIDDIFQCLDKTNLVFNDWEHSKRGDKTEVIPEKLAEKLNCPVADIYPQFHCDSFFGSKYGLFNGEVLARLKNFLINEQGIQCVRDRCWWSTSALFSILTIKENCSFFNFTQSENGQERTGNCADADPFIYKGGVLYNEQGLKPIHRIHYMNYPSIGFSRLCKGEAVNIRYADTFLDYRFLKDPSQKPQTLKEPSSLTQMNRKVNSVIKKVGKFF